MSLMAGIVRVVRLKGSAVKVERHDCFGWVGVFLRASAGASRGKLTDDYFFAELVFGVTVDGPGGTGDGLRNFCAL